MEQVMKLENNTGTGAERKLTAEEQSRMKELTEILNRASEAYYNKDTEIMSNFEYDKLYDELSGQDHQEVSWKQL